MRNRSPVAIVFSIVVLDLIGFGIVIPLINLYGIHYGAGAIQLAVLASAYSTMQFIFAPFWGALSDRVGRRPVLLVSLCGSTMSYVLFGMAEGYGVLLASRILAGVFAANISAAHAYIADVTERSERTKGMGLIGAAFGIGFTLGPPLGGISAHLWGLGVPGFIAAAFSGTTLVLAYFLLPESLAVEKRSSGQSLYRSPFSRQSFKALQAMPVVRALVLLFFVATFAFAQFEQAFAPYLQSKFSLATDEAGYKAGMLLFWLGILGVIVQALLVKPLVAALSEWRMLVIGLTVEGLAFAVLPFIPTYSELFIYGCLIPFGAGIANPCLTSLISLNTNEREQGAMLGLAQGFSSLGRVLGPASALLLFSLWQSLPFIAGGVLLWVTALAASWVYARRNTL